VDNLVRENSITYGLATPTAIAVDGSGGIYVSESGKNRVSIFNSGGVLLSRLLGLDKPLGIAVDGNGKIFVCNAGRKNVEVYSGGLNLLFKLGSGNNEFVLPVGIALGNDGKIYVVDAKTSLVKVYLPNGAFSFSFGGKGSDDGKLFFPTSISFARATEEVIVSDLQLTLTGVQGARIQVFDKNGAYRRKFGIYDSALCSSEPEKCLIKPAGTAVDPDGRIYVSDAHQHIVQVFANDGIHIKTVYDKNRPMRTPVGIALDGYTGKLYVASLNSSTVEVYGSGASGSGTLSFSGSGGGGACSIAGHSSTSITGYFLPFFGLALFLLARRKRR
jgi:DNA-binding beta-propeller fold protein YncE